MIREIILHMNRAMNVALKRIAATLKAWWSVIKRPKTLKRIVVWGAAGLLFMGLLGGAFILYLAKDLPSVEQIDNREVVQSTKIYDRTGKVLLYEISGGQRRTIIPFEAIPQSLKNAVLAIEDENFYRRDIAIDWRGVLRAVFVDIKNRGKNLQGGSTITQQLARNAFLSPEQTPIRKARELILAIYLNSHYTKDQILAFYLNEIPFGSTLYGVEAASNAYFNKPVKDLSIAQSAVLAALLQAPSYYSPWGSHTVDLFARQKLVLKKMSTLGMITKDELDRALAEKITFAVRSQGIKAPHFVLMVQDYLVKKYGEDSVRRGGLSVITTLDWTLQEIGEQVVKEGAERNEKLYDGKNAALVAEDPKTGQILALVGSRDYFDIKREGNFNAASQGLRQPGSALKPFTYLTAFEKGFLPETVLYDTPIEFVPNNPDCPAIPDYNSEKNDCFHPQNFDLKFRGPVTIRESLAQSINIPAVKTLYLAKMPDVLETLSNFGITTLNDPSRYGLSLVLGGGEVHLTELVNAYSVLAEEGVRHDQAMILEIKDDTGNVLESFTDKNERVVDAQYPRLVTSILSDEEARRGLFGSSFDLTVFPGYDVALKTGTSNDYRDAWTLGFTPTLAAGVWAGNNDNKPMHKQGSSILAAVPIWSAFMKKALQTQPQETFTKPDPTTPSKPFFAGDTSGGLHSELFWVSRNDPSGPSPLDPTTDPQFNNWETALITWAQSNPQAIPDSQSSPNTPLITIEEPRSGTTLSGQISVKATINSASPLTFINVVWNGVSLQNIPLVNQTSYNLSFSFIPQDNRPQNTLEISAVNAKGAVSTVRTILYR